MARKDAIQITTTDDEIMQAMARVVTSEPYKDMIKNAPMLVMVFGFLGVDLVKELIKGNEETEE